MKPASGPEYSVPASGWAGTKCTPSGTSGPTSRITDCLVEPTSVTIAPGARCGAIAARDLRDTRRPASTASRNPPRRPPRPDLASTSSTMPEFGTRSSVACGAGAAPRLGARGRPARARCARPNCRSARRRSAPAARKAAQPWAAHERRQRVGHQPDLLLGADRDAQAIAAGRSRAPRARSGRACAGTRRAASARSGEPKSASTKLPSLGQTLIPAARSASVSRARYSVLCARPVSTQPGSSSAAIAAACAPTETLNGERTRLSTSTPPAARRPSRCARRPGRRSC